ncbi:hypothetical protein Nm8I071_47670 [Nonomuraea sp. TT08I-71]|nr:hypothetical protein Nm8I071_47670 [Nonomuraea sp. TT08I-71]
MSAADRWEYGSVFPQLIPTGNTRTKLPPMRLYGSGRQALHALVEFGRRDRGWTAVHLPAYYCPEVVESVTGLLPIRRYDAGPLGRQEPPDAGPTEVVVVVAYFGAQPTLPATEAEVIVDITHDPTAPWADQLAADYLFASLRKTLPLPDGGAVWSHRRRPLPPAPSADPEHLANAGRSLAAMCLKRAYLDGMSIDKATYLTLAAEAEAGLRSTVVSAISEYSRHLLPVLPVAELRRRRIANSVHLAAALDGRPGVTVHGRTFGVVLEFDTPRRRDTVRAGLIARNIYPAVLWALPAQATPSRQLDLSRRMLYLHSDIRWRDTDLDRVAAAVRALCDEPADRPAPDSTPRHAGYAAGALR